MEFEFCKYNLQIILQYSYFWSVWVTSLVIRSEVWTEIGFQRWSEWCMLDVYREIN